MTMSRGRYSAGAARPGAATRATPSARARRHLVPSPDPRDVLSMLWDHRRERPGKALGNYLGNTAASGEKHCVARRVFDRLRIKNRRRISHGWERKCYHCWSGLVAQRDKHTDLINHHHDPPSVELSDHQPCPVLSSKSNPPGQLIPTVRPVPTERPPSFCPSVCPPARASILPSAHPSIRPSIQPPEFSSAHPRSHRFTCPSDRQSTRAAALPKHLSTRPSRNLSTRPSKHPPSIRTFVHPTSVHPPPSARPSDHSSVHHPSARPPVRPIRLIHPIHLFIIRQPVRRSVQSAVHMTIRPPTLPSFWPSVRPAVLLIIRPPKHRTPTLPRTARLSSRAPVHPIHPCTRPSKHRFT